MTTLLLLRHGESVDRQLGEADSDRRLTDAGRLSIELLSQHLKNKNYAPGIFLSSDATRAAETTQIVLKQFNHLDLAATFHRDLYLSDVDGYVTLIQKSVKQEDQILLVGHNPSISSLIGWFTGNYLTFLFPGQLAVIDVNTADVKALVAGTGRLNEIMGPFMK